MGNKFPVNQFELYVNWARNVHSRNPDSTFLFDGFSTPSGADHTSKEWVDYSDSVGSLAKSIVESLSREGIRAYSINNLRMLESIRIIQAVNFYVAPLGTIQHKVGWLSTSKGIVISADSWSQIKGALPGTWEAGSKYTPVTLFGNTVRGEHATEKADTRPRLEAFEISAESLATACFKVMGTN